MKLQYTLLFLILLLCACTAQPTPIVATSVPMEATPTVATVSTVTGEDPTAINTPAQLATDLPTAVPPIDLEREVEGGLNKLPIPANGKFQYYEIATKTWWPIQVKWDKALSQFRITVSPVAGTPDISLTQTIGVIGKAGIVFKSLPAMWLTRTADGSIIVTTDADIDKGRGLRLLRLSPTP